MTNTASDPREEAEQAVIDAIYTEHAERNVCAAYRQGLIAEIEAMPCLVPDINGMRCDEVPEGQWCPLCGYRVSRLAELRRAP